MFRDTRTLKQNQENSQEYVQRIIFYKSQNVGNPLFDNFREDGHRKWWRSVWKSSGNLGHGLKISLKTWNEIMVNFWNQKPRNQEAKKPFLFLSKGIPSSPQHTDSHPCTRPPSWRTRVSSPMILCLRKYRKNDALCCHLLNRFYGTYYQIDSPKAPGDYSASIRFNNFSILFLERPKTQHFMIPDLLAPLEPLFMS